MSDADQVASDADKFDAAISTMRTEHLRRCLAKIEDEILGRTVVPGEVELLVLPANRDAIFSTGRTTIDIDEELRGAEIPWYLQSMVSKIVEYAKSLESAIRKHRDQRGDDRCWMDDEELYRSLPEGYTVPARDSSVELAACERFIQCRHNPGVEYVSPQRRIEELEAVIARVREYAVGVNATFERLALSPSVSLIDVIGIIDSPDYKGQAVPPIKEYDKTDFSIHHPVSCES